MLDESYYDLDFETKEWLRKYVKWGVTRKDLGLTKEIIEDFKNNDLQLSENTLLYRGISITKDYEKSFSLNTFSEDILDILIGEKKQLVYNEKRITSWSKNEEIVENEFGGVKNFFILSSYFNSKDTIVDLTLLPDYIEKFDQEEVIVHPGKYNCIIERIS
jgi:hypothetical protein